MHVCDNVRVGNGWYVSKDECEKQTQVWVDAYNGLLTVTYYIISIITAPAYYIPYCD